MQPLTQYLLTGSIVASALGGLVLCLVIIRYGFPAPEDEAPDEAQRRIFLTRLGHAVAAFCFAVTALLTAAALGARGSGGAAADTDVGRLTTEIRALDERVAAVEQAVVRVSHSLDALLEHAERANAAPPAATPAR
ncbi:MAG TPA: hypothetical protein VNO23_07640 [Candidatus Binatia bacterium]|nr:hypothetical protein [Candidatus Binatia bacterium]